MKTLFSTREAAEYLGVSVSTVKYYVYSAEKLRGQLLGHSLVFTKSDLDKLNKTRRPPGRPGKGTK